MRRKHPTKLVEAAACCLLSSLHDVNGLDIEGGDIWDALSSCSQAWATTASYENSSAASYLVRDFPSKRSPQEVEAAAFFHPSSLGAAPVSAVTVSLPRPVVATPSAGTSHRGNSPPMAPSQRRSCS